MRNVPVLFLYVYLFSKWASVIFSSFRCFCNFVAVASSSFLCKWQNNDCNDKRIEITWRIFTLKLWSSNVVIIASSKVWRSLSSLLIFSSILASCWRRLFLMQYLLPNIYLRIEPVIVEGKTPVDHCLDVFKSLVRTPSQKSRLHKLTTTSRAKLTLVTCIRLSHWHPSPTLYEPPSAELAGSPSFKG